MVAKAGGYYGLEFQGARGGTQGDPLSPTIFNVVVDAVVINWVKVILDGAEDRGDRVQEGRNQTALFYVDDGMVSSSDPQWLWGAFITPVGIFNKVVLWNNVVMTVGMFSAHARQRGTSWRRMGNG